MIALGCAPLLYFSAATRGALILCPDDCLTLTLPLRATAAELLRAGHLPIWNPYYYGGMPLFAAAQGGLLFPLNWFFLFFPAQMAANISTLGAYALAGVGAFLYARRNGASVLGAFVSGSVWQWGGFLVAHLGHTNVVHTAALLPWVLWAIDNYADTRRRTHAALIALLVALQIFAGHQQSAVYSLMLAAAYVVFQGARAGEQAEGRRPYFVALSMLMLGVILAAVQILPTFELMRNSLRAEATYEFFSSYSLPPSFLLTYFAPYILGGGDGDFFSATYIGPPSYAEYVGYVGLGALMLALLAPLLRRDALTRFWTVVALVALALALGRFWPFDLYRVVYYVPVLNLFRAPARHVMEVDFALAVLAGRAVTTLEGSSRRARTAALTLFVATVVFIFVYLSVTTLRPAEFGPGRPILRISLLRVPELFLPVLFAGLSGWALWRFARGRRASSCLLLLVMAADLCVWGHFSGWRHSPGREHAVWGTPEAVEFLRAREGDGNVRPRILTIDGHFYPGAVQIIPPPPLVPFTLEVQPNIYMLHGIQNAAGSDGFGLSRYSRLTGDMKLWGELSTPEQALGPSRAFDLLHTRYLLARSPVARPAADGAQPLEETPSVPLVQIGGLPFAASEMKFPHLAGQDYRFAFPRLTATRVALLTTLERSSTARHGDTVATLHLQTDDGREFRFDLRAGIDTSEWSYEREAAQQRIEHGRANVGTSYQVADPEGNFEGHTYVASFTLPERATITGGYIEIVRTPQAPQLNLVLSRASLIDDDTGKVMPWRSGWVAAERAVAFNTMDERWRRVGELRDVWIYENQWVLPRAWLATEALRLPDTNVLRVIQGGRLEDGSVWNPRRTALINEEDTQFTLSGDGESGEAIVSKYEPNLIEVRTSSDTPAILVLGENHYPGWNAFVDGQAVETLRVNYNLRGVALPAGEHLVQFVYRPKSLLLGAVLSLLAAMSLSLWCLRRPLSTVESN